MTAAHGAQEPLTTVQGIPGEQTAVRHRARGNAGRGKPSRTRLTLLALTPSACAALLAVLAVAVVVHNAGQPHLLSGGTLIAVCVLGGLLLLVMLASVVQARMVAAAGDAVPSEQPRLPPSAAPVAGPADVPVEIGRAPRGETAGEDVFVHLSRRLQSLVHRQIELLDRLENEVEEPDLLKGLFNVDHLATRMRRHAENLAVLGGAVPRRQWTRPISVMEVLRSAVSETLDYARVQIIPRAPGALNGYAVADVIHLLAELVENATAFSPPDTKVVLRAYPVTAGLAIEIDDRGLGMRMDEYERLNALLREPTGISVEELLQGARIGLYVVAQLARRHGIAIQLQANITGGSQALVVLPKPLLAVEPRAADAQPALPRQQSRPGPALDPIGSRADAYTSDAYTSDSYTSDTYAATGSQRAYGARHGSSDAMPVPPPLHEVAPPLPPPPQAPPPQPAPPQAAPPQPASARRLPPVPPAEDSIFTAKRPAIRGPGGFLLDDEPMPDNRPPLPRRRPQEHIAAPLLGASEDPASRVGDEPSPTLMADFRRGLTEGSTAPGLGINRLDDAQTQEGDT